MVKVFVTKKNNLNLRKYRIKDFSMCALLYIFIATSQTDDQEISDEPAVKRIRLDTDNETAQELTTHEAVQDVHVQEVQIAQDFASEIPDSNEQVVSSEGFVIHASWME